MATPKRNPALGGDALAFLSRLNEESAEARRARKAEAVRLALTDAMRATRKRANLKQGEVANVLGVSQGWVSKLESANHDHLIESVAKYLDALGADLCLTVRTARDEHPVNYERLLGEGGTHYRMHRFPRLQAFGRPSRSALDMGPGVVTA